MISTFKQFIEKALSLGIKSEFSPIQKHQIRNANLGGIISFVFAIISTIATSFYIPFPYIYIPLLGSFLYLMVFVLNYYGLYRLGSLSTWIISLLMFFWMAGAYGESSNAYLLLIIAEMMAILNFEQQSKWIIFTTSLPVILAIITYTTHFSLFLIPTVTEEQLAHINPILFFAVILGCGVTVWTHRLQVQHQMKRIEEKYEELEHTNTELQKTNEELDRFVYSVSHDLRAPITSVMGLIDLCNTDKENLDLYLALQQKSMHKLDSFIRDILNYARNSRLEIMPAPLDLVAMIRENYENHSYAQSAEEIQLIIEKKGTSPLYSDAFRLNIVLANIISNAIRYRNPAANPSYVRFEIDSTPEMTTISVSDNGIGISAEHLEHIFQMFYRANAKVSGSGLGLYIVKEALNKMNGKIAVKSEVAKGSIFTISIPNMMHSSMN